MDVSMTKKRLLQILELLYKRTDEEGSPNKYFWGSRTFEIPELKMLIDAVSSARFITKKKSEALIEKIALLAGDSQYEDMNKHIVATSRAKSDNKKIYYIVDTITDAINQKKKLQFKYTEYNADKEKVFRHNGEIYTISPYVLYWNEDYYYVVGYYDNREIVAAFRVDRLHNPKIIEQKAVPKPKDFNIDNYAKKIFKMFDGDDVEVELECENSLMKYIIDRYGLDVETNRNTDSTFIAKVSATLSPTFYSWVFQFAGQMKIIGPEVAVSEYKAMLKKCIED